MRYHDHPIVAGLKTYPLVNSHLTMERSTMLYGSIMVNPLWPDWASYSIANFVCLPGRVLYTPIHQKPCFISMDWFKGKLKQENPMNFMVKTHGFPVTIFPTKPIHGLAVEPNSPARWPKRSPVRSATRTWGHLPVSSVMGTRTALWSPSRWWNCHVATAFTRTVLPGRSWKSMEIWFGDALGMILDLFFWGMILFFWECFGKYSETWTCTPTVCICGKWFAIDVQTLCVFFFFVYIFN